MPHQRQHVRIPVSLQVRYLSEGDLQRDMALNLSSGGLFVRTSKPLEIGTELDLEVLLANQTPMRVRGKVAWLRGDAPDGQSGMGIQFVGPIDPLLAELARLGRDR